MEATDVPHLFCPRGAITRAVLNEAPRVVLVPELGHSQPVSPSPTLKRLQRLLFIPMRSRLKPWTVLVRGDCCLIPKYFVLNIGQWSFINST